MPGREIPDEAFLAQIYGQPDLVRRRQVLRETLARFESLGRAHFRSLARANVARWQGAAPSSRPSGLDLRVLAGDWGVVAGRLTREWGEVFAVLNMANAHVPGGGYVEGMVAQEENLFRRTDCHYSVKDEHLAPGSRDRYSGEQVALLSGRDGRVYLDVSSPRVCIRGPEDRSRPDLGYAWLPDEAVFPFVELRAAAVDRRDGAPFNREEMAHRVCAQLDTLVAGGVRHVVLSAFGCGAFRNPASEVARLYRHALQARAGHFDCVAFAIFHAGYGPDNYTPFREVLAPGG
jgi:hypothetical protein